MEQRAARSCRALATCSMTTRSGRWCATCARPSPASKLGPESTMRFTPYAARSTRPPSALRKGRRGNDDPQRQRSAAQRRGRFAHAAALRAARRLEAQRREVWLRARPMRRLHGASRRQAGFFVRDADRAPRRQEGHHARRPRHGARAGADPARLHGGAGGAVRLLHSRHDDAGAGAAAGQSASKRHGDSQNPRTTSVPLRYSHADLARDTSGAGVDEDRPDGRCPMSGNIRIVSRRAVLAGSGALVFGFGAAPRVLAQDAAVPGAPGAPAPSPPLPGSLKQTSMLDSWIRIDADGTITVCTGKAELGQGIKTALTQIAAEQLDADFGALKLVTADTTVTPDEGYTAGSQSMQESGTAILNAAAQVRQI